MHNLAVFANLRNLNLFAGCLCPFGVESLQETLIPALQNSLQAAGLGRADPTLWVGGYFRSQIDLRRPTQNAPALIQ